MPKLNRVQAIGIKTETTQNTAVSLTSTDYIVAKDIEFNVNPEVLNRDFRRASMSNLDHVIGKRFASIKFSTELKNCGTAGVQYAPLGAALQACGFVESTTATNSLAFVTVTNGGTTAYTSAPGVTITGTGTGAAAIASVGSDQKVQGIIVTAAGSGYTAAPAIGFTGGGGTGAAATASTSGTYTYAPTSVAAANFFGPGKSSTISVYKNGIYHSVAGCVGTWKLSSNSGKFPTLEFEFRGLYSNPTDAAMPTTTYLTQYPAIWASAPVNVHGFAAIIDKIEIDWANTIAPRDDAGSANSIKGFMLTDRDPKGSLDVEMESIAAHDFFGQLMSSASLPLGTTWGSTTGNIVHMSMPKVQYMDSQYSDRNQIMTAGVPVQINGNTGDDELIFVFA